MRRLVMLLVLSFMFTSAGLASVIQTTADLPPAGGIFPVPTLCISFVCVVNGVIGNIVPTAHLISAGNEIVTATAGFTGNAFQNNSGSPGAPLGMLTLTGPLDLLYLGRSSLDELGTFTSQITFLDWTGSIAGHTAEVMLNPAHPSLGQATVSQLPGRDLFRVDSFFDIFAELSADGGPFVPSPPRHLVLASAPEPAGVELAILGVLGLALVRRRRSTA